MRSFGVLNEVVCDTVCRLFHAHSYPSEVRRTSAPSHGVG